ncbi:hypothetical protein [Lysobacter xanthus]
MRQVAKTILGYAAATYLTMVLVLLAYGIAAPREGDHEVLLGAGANGPSLLVGMKSRAEQTPQGLRIEAGRYYFAVPRSLSQRSLWVVTRTEDDTPTVRRSAPAFWTVLALFALSLLGTWWYWIRGPSGATPAAPES